MPAAAVDWSSLPADLVRCVGDIFLATSDVDYYMSLRAACSSWRGATIDPHGPDRRFNPRGWVMLDPIGTKSDSGRCVLLHVHSGRWLSKNLPMLRNHVCLASTTDGLLVLRNVSKSLQMCILNPFTGYQLRRFSVTPKLARNLDSSVVVAPGPSPTLYIFRRKQPGPVACVDPICGRVSVFDVNRCPCRLQWFDNVVVFQGRIYGVTFMGAVMVVEANTLQGDNEPTITTVVNANCFGPDCTLFLVDNAGELLLVRLRKYVEEAIHVFKVDVENKTVKKIGCIGNRAIFLAPHCLSVAVGNLPAIEGNCVYYPFSWNKHIWLYSYRLDDDKKRVVNEPHMYPYVRRYVSVHTNS